MNNYTTNYTTCKASKHGTVRGSQYYAFATTMPDGSIVESAEVVSAKLDRKPQSRTKLSRGFLAAEAKRAAARRGMEANGWL